MIDERLHRAICESVSNMLVRLSRSFVKMYPDCEETVDDAVVVGAAAFLAALCLEAVELDADEVARERQPQGATNLIKGLVEEILDAARRGAELRRAAT